MNCNNCGARLSCGCQKKRATDGTSCCSTCLPFYEKKLKAEKELNTIKTPNNTWGPDRYTANK